MVPNRAFACSPPSHSAEQYTALNTSYALQRITGNAGRAKGPDSPAEGDGQPAMGGTDA